MNRKVPANSLFENLLNIGKLSSCAERFLIHDIPKEKPRDSAGRSFFDENGIGVDDFFFHPLLI